MVVGECLYHNKEYVVKIDFTMKNLFVSVLLIIGISVTSCAEKETLFYITTSVIPEGAGVITPSSTEVLEGSNVSFKATPNGEYIFTGWSGSISGTTNPQKITVTSDMNVTANFTLRSYPLTLSTEGEGQIIEKVISTRADYTSGTVVELSAQPSEHWQFSHWEGDITGPENPAQITVSSAKSVKAIFTKKSYDYSLKIVGPGAVDEEIVESTRATLEAGTIVRLSAYPDTRNNAVFSGWSGDITGTDHVIEVNIDDVKNITATFERAPARKYELPDLKAPSSHRKKLYYDYDFSQFSTYPTGFFPLDYNSDGILDVITCASQFLDNEKIPIGFYQGNEYGEFEIDILNHNKHIGPVYGPKKTFSGDFNGDSKVDICIVSHGIDREPWPGESPTFLMSSVTGEYTFYKVSDALGYYHGSAAGDFDNDGDLDVVLIEHRDKSLMLVNDGLGNMSVRDDILNIDVISSSMYTCEFFDINHDGFLDLIVGGHEHEGYEKEQYSYENPTCVFWGNGINFKGNYTRLPRFKNGYGIILDYKFYDIDNDGQEEILNIRTGDGYSVPSYCGWSLQIVDFNGSSFTDVTTKYIDDSDNSEMNGSAVTWIDVEIIEGETYLCGLIYTNAQKLFKINNDKFISCRENNDTLIYSPSGGICIYSDGYLSINESVITNFAEDSYSGRTCIKFSDWSLWSSVNFVMSPYDLVNGSDLLYLLDHNYGLEFYIKNYEPTLTFDVKVESIKDVTTGESASFVYYYNAEEHLSELGVWERIFIPLKDLNKEENLSYDYFKSINNINFITTSSGGQNFYLDEIRIRKAL